MAESLQTLYAIQQNTGEELERVTTNHRKLRLTLRTKETATKHKKYLTTLWDDFQKTHGILEATVSNKSTEYWEKGYFNFIKNKYDEGIQFLETFKESDNNASLIDLEQDKDPKPIIEDIDDKEQTNKSVISDNISESGNERNKSPELPIHTITNQDNWHLQIYANQNDRNGQNSQRQENIYDEID